MRSRLSILLAVLVLASCSTTRFIPEGQYRLASNSVTVLNDPKFNQNEISPYIKQQPNSYFIFGWNPFLNVYNWGDNSGEGLDKVWRKIGVPPVVFNPSLVESSRENIVNHLKYLGYYDSTVDAEVSTKNRLAHVDYYVKLGKRYSIDAIEYDVPDQPEFAKLFYADTLNNLVRPGDYLSESLLESESVRSSALFRENGFYEFNKNNYFFVADTITTPGRTSLKYCVKSYTRNESPDEAEPLVQSRIGNVSISHSDDIKLREEVLTKLNLLNPGDIYKESLVNKTYARYSALRLFSSVSMQLHPSDSALVDCDIKLTESKRQGFKADLQVSTNSSTLIGISPQLSWFHKNVFHGGEWLTLGFSGNFQFKPGTDVHSTVLGANATLSLPSFLGLPYSAFKGSGIPRTEIKLAYNYQNRPEYVRHVASANYGYNWHTDNNLYFTLDPLQMNFVYLTSLSEDFLLVLARNPYMRDAYIDHIDAGIGGSVYKTTTSDLIPKTSYSFIQFTYDLSGNLISLFNPLMPVDETDKRLLLGVPYTQYFRGELQACKAWRFGRDNGQSLAMRFWGGIGHAYGNSYSMPYEKQFYCGGANSMRAWQTHALGPGRDPLATEFAIPSQTGNVKLEADLEWRYKLVWKLEGALFAEAGNVWNLNYDKPSFESVAVDWGLGVRLNLDFILVRLDMGLKLRDPSMLAEHTWRAPAYWFADDGYAIHFGVGYPF